MLLDTGIPTKLAIVIITLIVGTGIPIMLMDIVINTMMMVTGIPIMLVGIGIPTMVVGTPTIPVGIGINHNVCGIKYSHNTCGNGCSHKKTIRFHKPCGTAVPTNLSEQTTLHKSAAWWLSHALASAGPDCGGLVLSKLKLL